MCAVRTSYAATRPVRLLRRFPSWLAAGRAGNVATTRRSRRTSRRHSALREASLEGDLAVPAGANGIVLFAHGSGSSRASPRNAWVAARLARAGLATLLFDLLTRDEEQRDIHTREHRFDIPLLSQRLVLASDWVDAQPELRTLRVGYFGASTGAAAALASQWLVEFLVVRSAG